MTQPPPADENELKLPALNPLIKLFKSTPDRNGHPRWSLYHPAANQYYQLNWAEFECIARFHKHETAGALVKDINTNTTLEIDNDDVKQLTIFLQQNALVNLENQSPELAADKPLWKRLVHGYLFFTLPLFKSENFLKKTLPSVAPFLSKPFMVAMLVLLSIGVLLTIQRFDEFTHTFLDMFSVKGAILTFLAFSAIKIVHEFSHAYVATKHGISVPHMGAAFIVMYPVLYTETTASWQLDSRRKRIEIGLAGVMAELALAAIFLILWHILPPGAGRSLCFAVVAISLIGSLFVNLNPLMRFDGYFVLSDALNIENLHARAIALARWTLRKTLFGLQDPAPDTFPPPLQKFMIGFGFSIIIYRFFLFLGIAFLVYTIFFKPLGLFMMVLELLWFIGVPLWSELKIWWQRKNDILSSPRSHISFAIATMILLFTLLPFHTTIAVKGLAQAAQNRAIYAPSASFIHTLNVQEGQSVKEGDILVRLESDTLEKDYKSAKIALENLKNQQRREKTDIEFYRQNVTSLENALDNAKQTLNTLQKQKDRLIVKAPFNGTIHDLSPEIHENRYISKEKRLFNLINKNKINYIAYINENQRPRIKPQNQATFHPDFSLFSKTDLIVTAIDPINIKVLSKPELSSLHGGDIPSIADAGQITPLEPTYIIRLKLLNNKDNDKKMIIQRGQIHIKAQRQSALVSTFKRTAALIIRESNLN